MKKRDLTKKVLCTVLAASVFGVCGNAFAQANDFCEDEFHLEEGQHYTDNGNNVYFEMLLLLLMAPMKCRMYKLKEKQV